MEVETVTSRLSRTKHQETTLRRAASVCVCMEKLLYVQSPSPFFGVFSFFLRPATSGFFRIFLAKPNNSTVRMLYGNRSNHVDLAVCFERFFFAAAAARLPMQNTNESVWPEPLFRSPLPPVLVWAFPKRRVRRKNCFSCRDSFSLHRSYPPLCGNVEASRAFSRLDFSNSAHLFSSRALSLHRPRPHDE